MMPDELWRRYKVCIWYHIGDKKWVVEKAHRSQSIGIKERLFLPSLKAEASAPEIL